MRRPLLSSRVTTIKWLGVGQLVMSILIFILGVAYFSTDFAEVGKVATTNTDGEAVTQRTWTYAATLILTLIMVLMGMLAGVPAAAMSRYEGLTHNISLKNQVLVNSVVNGFASIAYMVFAGTDFFEDIDKLQIFDMDDADEMKATYAMFIVVFVLAFFNMIIAFSTVVAASLWTPREGGAEPSRGGDYIVEEPPYVREERIRPAEYHSRDRRYGGPAAVNNGYYGPGYRTLPALKYY